MVKSQKAKKYYRIRKNRPIFLKKWFWLVFLSICTLSAGVYFAIFSSKFQIENVEISGNRQTDAQTLQSEISGQIEKKFLSFSSKSIFLLNLGAVKDDLLNKFPQVAQANIKRQLPNKLVVEINERLPVGVWCNNPNCFLIDKNGIAYESSPPQSELLIKSKIVSKNFVLGDKVVEDQLLQSIINIQKKLNIFEIPITEFSIMENQRLNVRTGYGWEIYFDAGGDMAWQMTKLSLLLEQEIPVEKRVELEYIDLRFSKIYYKYK